MEEEQKPTDSVSENQQTVEIPQTDELSGNHDQPDLDTAETHTDAAPAQEQEREQETEQEKTVQPNPSEGVPLPPTPTVDGTSEPHIAHKHRKAIIIAGAALAALLVIASAVTILLTQNNKAVQSTSNQQAAGSNKVPEASKQDTQQESKKEIVATDLAKFINPTTGETWLPTAKPIAAQGWLKSELLSSYTAYSNGTGGTVTAEEQLAQNMPQYREVGARGGSKIILTYTAPDMGQQLLLFEKAPDGKVTLIAKPQTSGTYATEYRSDEAYLAGLKDMITTKVSAVDTSTHYESLSVPETIPLENGEVLQKPEYLSLTSTVYDPSNTGVSGVKVRELGGSTLYRTEQAYADTKLTNIGYALVTPLGTEIGLEYEPNTISLEKYTFDNGRNAQYKDNGKTVTDSIMAIARGCGGTAAAVTRTDALKKTDLVSVGKTDAGRTVYMLKDENGALNKKAYEEYKSAWPENPNQVTFAEYLAEHAIMIIENKAGELLVYTRGRYSLVGGCAKPVVYLYPTEARSVSVSVGANVTVSDPLYGAQGWQGVWAEPSGRLTYAGQNYDSLFWEGQGLGGYPGITGGTVVRRVDAAKTMRTQLLAQGLNTKETADFMEFWTAKIPSKPYVRLTWLTTRQMDALAPLNVWPKPTTTIRVFLDMDGYDKPFKLPAQKLTKVERKGFTVVEWGGLTAEGLR